MSRVKGNTGHFLDSLKQWTFLQRRCSTFVKLWNWLGLTFPWHFLRSLRHHPFQRDTRVSHPALQGYIYCTYLYHRSLRILRLADVILNHYNLTCSCQPHPIVRIAQCKMNGMLLCLSAISSLLAAGNCAYQPNWDSLDARLLPAWYDEAKVGVFPVWGLYSVPSIVNEWFWYDWKVRKNPEIVEYMEKNYPARFTYADFAPMFKAEMYDPNAWADLFAKSGAKWAHLVYQRCSLRYGEYSSHCRYVVPTTKHHSGYTLWPTNTSWNWNTKDTGPHRDLIGQWITQVLLFFSVRSQQHCLTSHQPCLCNNYTTLLWILLYWWTGDLASAVRNRTTLKYGLYFSLFEWFNPLFLQDQANGFKTQDYVRVCVLRSEVISYATKACMWLNTHYHYK